MWRMPHRASVFIEKGVMKWDSKPVMAQLVPNHLLYSASLKLMGPDTHAANCIGYEGLSL